MISVGGSSTAKKADVVQKNRIWFSGVFKRASRVIFGRCVLIIDQVMDSNSENKASNSDDRILFRGRLRPMEIDVSLLQKWRHICTTQHVNTCSDGDD